MIKFVAAREPAPAGRPFRAVGYVLGLVSTALAVAQMVSFEEFARALQQYRLVSEQGSVALAITLIALEVFSVPFLFRLALSPFARLGSALCVVLLPCVWTAITVTALLDGVEVNNAGYFGGFLEMSVNPVVLLLNVAWMAVVGFSFGPMGGGKALKIR